MRKPARYAEFGVPEYRAVDPAHRGIRVWDFDTGAESPRLEAARIAWQPDPAVPPLTIGIPPLFDSP